MTPLDDAQPAFSDLLRRARRTAGLTQEQLAERAGLSARGISDLERGVRRAPHQETLALLADALALTRAERSHWEQARSHATRAVLESGGVTGARQSAMSQLPNPLTPLIGRERDSRVIGALLRDPSTRLVTLSGAGGVGKTRLGIAVARQTIDVFPDGVFFVDVSSIRDPKLVIPAIARTLAVRESANQPLLATLQAFIASRRLLLVLDNFEQVVDAALDIGALLSSSSLMRVLITSRVPLRLSGEQEYVVPPLHVPTVEQTAQLWRVRESEAVELFVQRARAVTTGFDLTHTNGAVIATICRRLDGLPLAIELAAARIKVLSPQDILARLEQPLGLLTGGARDLPARQRTMRDTIRWSYDLIEPAERALLRMLSAFVGGWTLEAAEEIALAAGLEVDVLDGLASLVDAGLVTRHEQADGQSRFVMFETVREFGLEQAESLGATGSILLLHARYVVALVEEAEPGLRDDRQREWFRWLSVEQGNIRAVLQRSLVDREVDVELGRRLAVALTWFWFTHNQFREARDWLKLAAAAAEDVRDPVWARASVGLGMMLWRLGDIQAAISLVRDGLDFLCHTDERWHTLFATHQLAHLADEVGDPARAIRLFHESLEGYREIDDVWGVAFGHACLGRALEMQQRTDEARSHLEHAIDMFQKLGDEWFTATSIQRLGDVEFACGRFDDSAYWYRQSVKRGIELGDDLLAADALLRLGQISAELRQPERAAQLLGTARSIHDTYSMALFEPLRPAYEEAIASIKASLGPERFLDQWEHGRRMSLNQAVEYALESERIE